MTIESNTVDINDTVNHLIENSKIKPNGIREVSSGAYYDALAKHDVTKADVERIHGAVNHLETAAAHVALLDIEGRLANATADELKDSEYRKNLSSTVRLPSFGGATEVQVLAEKENRNPFSKDGETKMSYGVVRTSVSLKKRINKDFLAEADSRMRAALGVAPATVDAD